MTEYLLVDPRSGRGWSLPAAAAWRCWQKGCRVGATPNRAQNMARNNAVTTCSGDIGRAQDVQTAVCRLKPGEDDLFVSSSTPLRQLGQRLYAINAFPAACL